MPNSCATEEKKFDNLLGQLTALQQELKRPGANKPAIVRQIEGLLPEVQQAKSHLDACREKNGRPSQHMDVRRIDWQIKTGTKWWSGTDSPVYQEIYRDNTLLQRLILETGSSYRLDRGERRHYYWELKPSGVTVGTSQSGFVAPYTEPFPDGIRGHLRVKFLIRGDDAWEKVSIVSSVYHGEVKHVPGTIDELRWIETWDTFNFTRDIVLSLDPDEGYPAFTLLY